MSQNKPTIGVIGTVGLPACYGGFETLTQHLVQQLAAQFDFVVYCSGKTYAPAMRKPTYKNARLVYLPLQANGVQSIVYDIVSMLHALIFCDILLILGVSGCLFLPVIRLFSNKRIVVNIDGQEWRRAKWGKLASAFLKLSEAFAVRFADEVVAAREAFQDGNRLLESAPVAASVDDQILDARLRAGAAQGAVEQRDARDRKTLARRFLDRDRQRAGFDDDSF